MSEQEERKQEKVILDTIRDVFLAGIGALALTKEELEAIARQLVEKGEIAERDARKLVEDVWEKRKKRSEEWEDRVVRVVEERVEKVLDRLDIPRRKDLEVLHERIARLEEKVDTLSKRTGEEEAAG